MFQDPAGLLENDRVEAADGSGRRGGDGDASIRVDDDGDGPSPEAAADLVWDFDLSEQDLRLFHAPVYHAAIRTPTGRPSVLFLVE
jgi:hypothetical protein